MSSVTDGININNIADKMVIFGRQASKIATNVYLVNWLSVCPHGHACMHASTIIQILHLSQKADNYYFSSDLYLSGRLHILILHADQNIILLLLIKNISV